MKMNKKLFAKRIVDTVLKKDLIVRKQIRIDYDIIGNKDASFAVAGNSLTGDSIVYSFGVGTDVSFDTGLIKKYNLKVYAFDPTPKSVEWVKKNNSLPDGFIFNPWGVSNEDKMEKFYPPANDAYDSFSIDNIQNTDKRFVECQVYRLETIKKKLNHSKIDLLKMDIEGKEYDVLNDILASGDLCSQIAVEFHHRFINSGANKTKDIIKKLNGKGYKIFYVSDNGEEYSFIKA